MRELDVHLFGPGDVEIEAKLLSTSVDTHELDRVVAFLATETFVNRALWNPSITE